MDITETPHGQTELNLLTYLAPHPDSEIWVSRAITPTTIETLAGSQLEGCTVFLYVREGSSSIDIDGVTYNTSVPSIIYLRPDNESATSHSKTPRRYPSALSQSVSRLKY